MLIAQKYGGSSVATAQRIRAVSERIARTRAAGNDVVVVVSAMGDTTDDLITLARSVTPEPDPREMDLLLSTGEVVSCTLVAMALRSLGVPAVSLTAAQARIRTDPTHSRARIRSVDTDRLRAELSAGKVVVVTGFQGVTDEDDITTLGRGGSDTTAVALACALSAPVCEIYTDVPGVFTADPRVCPRAQKLDWIAYEEMLEMAQLGAKVMHPRSVELGQVYGVPIVVRSSFSDEPGTTISKGSEAMEHRNRVRGVAHDTDVARVSLVAVADHPGVVAKIFSPLAQAGVHVDVIVQTASVDGVTDVSFTVPRDDLAKAVKVCTDLMPAVGMRDVRGSDDYGKVSLVGVGIHGGTGIMAKMFETLANAGINIEMITTSEIRITAIIRRSRVRDAVELLHTAFGLDKE